MEATIAIARLKKGNDTQTIGCTYLCVVYAQQTTGQRRTNLHVGKRLKSLDVGTLPVALV